jgi:IS4 transposase
MVFLSNHEEWAASTIVDLYRARWEIEVFFKPQASHRKRP